MKITCDIINDLLPSYVDGVCSEDSCKWLKNICTIVPDAARN